MKRLFLSLFLLLGLSARSFAQQVPNGGLETWTVSATRERLQSWLTSDDILAQKIGVPTASRTVSRTTDKYAGTYAALLETKPVSVFPGFPGVLLLGSRLNDNNDYPGGLPFTSRPTGMQLRYKGTATMADDSAYATVALTRTVNGQQQVVAEGILFLPAAATYTLATVPLKYQSTATPDSLHITLSSGVFQRAQPGTKLYVDDIMMTTTSLPTATRPAAASALALYPNPSADGRFTLDARQEPVLLQAALTITDLTGRVVLRQDAQPGTPAMRTLDLHGQPTGIYTLQLATAQGPVARRLVIE